MSQKHNYAGVLDSKGRTYAEGHHRRRPQEAHTKKPACPFCKRAAELVGGLVIYPHRPDLDEKKFWRCAPCGAYVGCHPGTTNPLGTLADAETRKERSATHAVFDPIWREQRIVAGRLWRRGELYGWLATSLGISIEECHIGHFNVQRCQEARRELAKLLAPVETA
jgi:hypothetical protein